MWQEFWSETKLTFDRTFVCIISMPGNLEICYRWIIIWLSIVYCCFLTHFYVSCMSNYGMICLKTLYFFPVKILKIWGGIWVQIKHGPGVRWMIIWLPIQEILWLFLPEFFTHFYVSCMSHCGMICLHKPFGWMEMWRWLLSSFFVPSRLGSASLESV